MEFSQLAVPCVYALIFFLGYPSQYLLLHLDPAPLSKNELIAANVILVLILITYSKSVFVDPGTIPRNWNLGGGAAAAAEAKTDEKEEEAAAAAAAAVGKSRKWCFRCIPKMDHHCPWTNNCVSHTTFPHFIRFLMYTSIGLGMLQSFLFTRLAFLWTNFDMPSSLGPTKLQLAHLFAVIITNSITLFILGILFLRNLWCLAVNTTTIEGWEIERHKTLLRRARQYGGYLPSPDGAHQIRIKKQEFPYDIGIWANIVQGMNSANPLSWLNPLAPTPSVASGLAFETNGFEDEGTAWPPPDPDRAYRRSIKAPEGDAFRFGDPGMNAEETLKAFKARQFEDELRRRKSYAGRVYQKVMDDEDEYHRSGEAGRDEDGYAYGHGASDDGEEEDEDEKKKYGDGKQEGEAAWRNSEGERLKDFGVDEDVEFYDEQEDDIPLSELLARRRAASTSAYSRPSQ
ncbi:uncharacterized protein SETTUDRAFT_46547 [Exserohilum turcica Et28A]|uniref:Palmitoyltransferase PFA4 n=1 Tax=Exserohilum turcicum (strain 28A) TaxID=671987 RepID=R0IWL6_EXST2|nr:uncharacterized protein SETTUDRAFT_46547 [Exserohilum turcica Et28A]EOA88996.1 hypothetical protein SETTUDRAFT_46547 [Exserohilum turcica Et28A]